MNKANAVRVNKLMKLKFLQASIPDRKQLVIKAIIMSNGLLYQAATLLGLSRSDIHQYVKEFDLWTVIADQSESQVDIAEQKLFELIDCDKPDRDLLKFYLRCKAKSRGYSESPLVSIDNRQVTFQFENLEQPEEKIQLIDVEPTEPETDPEI